MAREEISIDSLLETQGTEGTALLATIEPVADDDSRVRITPFVADAGCSCAQAIAISKKEIKALFKTDQVHRCCGKNLTVVEVGFANDSLADVFRQLGGSSRGVSTPQTLTEATGMRSFVGMPRGRFGRFGPGRQGPMAARFTTLDAVLCGLANDICSGLCDQVITPYSVLNGTAMDSYMQCLRNCETNYEHCLGYPF